MNEEEFAAPKHPDYKRLSEYLATLEGQARTDPEIFVKTLANIVDIDSVTFLSYNRTIASMLQAGNVSEDAMENPEVKAAMEFGIILFLEGFLAGFFHSQKK